MFSNMWQERKGHTVNILSAQPTVSKKAGQQFINPRNVFKVSSTSIRSLRGLSEPWIRPLPHRHCHSLFLYKSLLEKPLHSIVRGITVILSFSDNFSWILKLHYARRKTFSSRVSCEASRVASFVCHIILCELKIFDEIQCNWLKIFHRVVEWIMIFSFVYEGDETFDRSNLCFDGNFYRRIFLFI